MIETVGDSPIEVDVKDGLIRIRFYAKNPEKTFNNKYTMKIDDNGRRQLIELLTNCSI